MENQSRHSMSSSRRAVLAAACMAFVELYWILPLLLGRNGLPKVLALVLPLRPLAWLVLPIGAGLLLLARARPAADKPSGLLSEDVPSLDNRDSPATIFKSVEHWMLQALSELEWKRFEQLCLQYYEALGFACKAAPPGPEGGLGIALFRDNPGKPVAVVQCKAWDDAVGAKEIRALLDRMAHEKAACGIFITAGGYTSEALALGAANPIQLIDGRAFLKKLEQLPKETLAALLKLAFDGDYATPTCASCGIKMISRESRHGPFWGCRNFPACSNALPRKS